MRAPARTAVLAVLAHLAVSSCAAQQGAPQDASLRERAAKAEAEQRFADAADLYLQLVHDEPDRASWVVAAGRCLGRSGRYNDALDLLDRSRDRFVGVLDITAMLARTHLLKAERDVGAIHPELSYAEASKLAQQVLDAMPDHEDARLILAQARYALGDVPAATAAAEEAVRRFPKHAGAQILVGRIAFDRFRALKQALQESQPDERQHAALVAEIDTWRQRARAAFLRATELDPERTFAHVALGDLAAWDKEYDRAFGHWLDALSIDPTETIDHDVVAAHVPWQQRRDGYRTAMLRYLQRPQAKPALAATLEWHMARATFDGGDFGQAMRSFERVLQANPDYTNAHYWVFLCAWRLGERDAAERAAAAYSAVSAPGFADVLRALAPELRGELSSALRWLGDRAYREGRIEPSRDINHTIACLVDSADAWNNFAFLCRETKRYDDALAGYQHALEKEPGSPQLWNDAGVILQYHLPSPENLAKAREHYERALELARTVLADPRADAQARERAAKAQQDATLNLQAMPAK